jgi:hypothetical protein
MRIVVDRDTIDKFWKARSNYAGVPKSGAEGWKEEERVSETETHGYGEYIELPNPLESVGFNITAQENRIQYGFNIMFREPRVLKNLSQPFTRTARSTKRKFYPTTPDLTGYLFDANDDPEADIVSGKNDEERESRIVSFGVYGSRIRRYKEIKDLFIDINDLSAITGSIIYCCVNRYNSMSKKPKVSLPHADLHMGINLSED